MISLLLIALAAFFNACMDSFENENFFESIFKNLNQKFWYKRESWKYAKKIFGYRFDAWHLSKSAMIFCIVGAIILFNPHFHWWIHFILFGIVWNVIFVITYHGLFKVK